MSGIGTALMFSPQASKSSLCMTCPNRFGCIAGEAISVTVREFQSWNGADDEEYWTIYTDLPDCRQLPDFLSDARISISLNDGSGMRVDGKIADARISKGVKIRVV